MNGDVKKIIQEYPENYCLFLEAAYGSCMMSEGGSQAIDRMLSKETLTNAKLLDIGFGLGGVAFHLAEQYNAYVAGVEINPWMVDEAKRRTPKPLNALIDFKEYHPEAALPFPDAYFDIVFSKGVLTHLRDKTTLFNESNRVLKPRGVFVIDDWLSPHKNQWGTRLKKMCEMENLTLYAETETSYKHLLTHAGFTSIDVREENINYYQYNLDIVSRLTKEKSSNTRNPVFNEYSLDEAIENYQLIADAIKDDELLVRWLRGTKR